MHSTETLNEFISDTILDAMDKKKITALVLLDFSKAFDSIEHSKLINKLRSLGLSEKAADWFKSFLSHRIQSVRIGHILSEPRVVENGVPQGSILGPFLFNIYIFDLPNIPNVCPLEFFVDDSKLYLSFTIKDAEVVETQLNSDLKRIAAWCCSFNLPINPEKTKLLLLGTPKMLQQMPENFNVIVLGKKIWPTSFAKDLAMILDTGLSYDNHVDEVVSKCTSILCQITRVKHIFDHQYTSIQ